MRQFPDFIDPEGRQPRPPAAPGAGAAPPPRKTLDDIRRELDAEHGAFLKEHAPDVDEPRIVEAEADDAPEESRSPAPVARSRRGRLVGYLAAAAIGFVAGQTTLVAYVIWARARGDVATRPAEPRPAAQSDVSVASPAPPSASHAIPSPRETAASASTDGDRRVRTVAPAADPPAAAGRTEPEPPSLPARPREIPATPSGAAPSTVVSRDAAASEATLREALNRWIAATKRGDIAAQMTFYAPRLDTYYLRHGVARDVAAAEKQRVFGRADFIRVSVGPPEIAFGRDGRTATTRFRKRYIIGVGDRERRGEVLQELRWEWTSAGWKIRSERDAGVIRREVSSARLRR